MGKFTHWVAYNIPTSAIGANGEIDLAAAGVKTSVAYQGPSPGKTEGIAHRYRFSVYALSTSNLVVGNGPNLDSRGNTVSADQTAYGMREAMKAQPGLILAEQHIEVSFGANASGRLPGS
jgi:phosphatidylethanolamine-binding protein (PEBP) family uncharacterized protein